VGIIPEKIKCIKGEKIPCLHIKNPNNQKKALKELSFQGSFDIISIVPTKEMYPMGKTKIKGTLPLCFIKEGKSFIAFSPALDLSTCGRTFEEAKKNFIEALELFFEECVSMGTLNEVLESCGWKKGRNKEWTPPAYIGEERIEFPHVACA